MPKKTTGSGLTLFRRGNKGNWILRGTVRGEYVYKSTKTANKQAAEAIRINREKELLDETIFGKSAVATFDEAVVSYLTVESRSDATKAIVTRLLNHFTGRRLREINQVAVDKMYEKLVPGGQVSPKITLVTMLNAILEHAARRGMCERPMLEKPKAPPTSTAFLYPDEATALVRSAATHLRPLLVFLIGVGCRPAEALRLDWRQVDLKGGQATLVLGKVGGREHIVVLRPVVLRALKSLPHRTGRVFRTWLTDGDDPRGPLGAPYTGERLTSAWESACVKAGLPGKWLEWTNKHGKRQRRFDPVHNPYSMRHTFATWHRCAHKDIQDLRDEVGWTTTRMPERYSKLLAKTYAPDVLAWWNGEVDLGLRETEELACRIRARLGWEPKDLWGLTSTKTVA